MRLFALLLTVLSLLVATGSAGASSVPPFPRLAGNWSHAEINVTIKKQPHTLILDRGRITQVTGGSLKLRERDGSLVTIPLAPRTLVTVYGYASSIDALMKRMNVLTMRIDGGTAVRVRATP